jgi:hypothetical protein
VLRIDLEHRVGLIRRRMRSATDRVAAARRAQRLESVMKQRVMGLALAFEDLNDHDDRQHARQKLTSHY